MMGWGNRGKPHNYSKADMQRDECLIGTATKLAVFADRAGPKESWHEPDEEGITAAVKGKILDNAHGDNGNHDTQWSKCECPDGTTISMTEKVITLRCSDTGDKVQLNLATVLALATYGARALVTQQERRAVLDAKKG
jgi:hypothetical protein